jgi:putative acetyltransferase
MFDLQSVKRTTWAAISQFEGLTTDGRHVHVRYRWGELSVRLGKVGEPATNVMGGELVYDGNYGDRHDFDIDWDEIECLTGIRSVNATHDPCNKRDYIVRPARAVDAPIIAILNRHVRTKAMPYLPSLHTTDEDLRYFTDNVLCDCCVTVAESAGEIIAFCATRVGWIDHLYVDPEFQGKGIGTILMRLALHDQTDVRLLVFQRNTKAITFYTKCWFREIERSDGGGNEEREPDVLMQWKAR